MQLKKLQCGSGTPHGSELKMWVHGSSVSLGRGEVMREGEMAQAEYE